MTEFETRSRNVVEVVSRLDGKVALVTGASRGIGQAIARALASAGAAVVPTARTVVALEDVVMGIRADGGVAEPLALDITDPEAITTTVQSVRSQFGCLDVVVNNAGSVPYYGPTEEMDLTEWDATIEVNLRGVFLVCRAAAPLLGESGGGSIINIGSIDGVVGMPYMAAYCAAKAGVVALTKALAAEWAQQRIRVNCVSPGAVATDMTATLVAAPGSELHQHLMAHTPQRRFAGPEEIAGAVVYLASDAASFTTGSVIAVDGGFAAV